MSATVQTEQRGPSPSASSSRWPQALFVRRKTQGRGWVRDRGRGFWLAANIGLAMAYVLLGTVVGIFFGAFGLFPAPIWLPAGLAAVAALAAGWRLAPGIYVGSLVVNTLLLGSDPVLSAAISAGNTLGPLAGAALTRRFRPATGLFTRFQGVLAFLAGCVLLHAAISGLGGAASLWLLRDLPLGDVLATAGAWLLCDAGGTFYFAPALALWLGVERMPAAPGARAPVKTAPVQDALVWSGTACATTLVFLMEFPPATLAPLLVFLLALPLSWIALRVSLRAAYTLLTLICVIASAGTVMGLGPFQSGMLANPMQAVGTLIVACGMNILTLLALVSERRDAEAALAEANHLLERRVAERTEALRQQADSDELTGLANRRAFLARGAAALRRAHNWQRPFSVIAFDLDDFRQVNDRAGRAAGDAALRAVAQGCAAHLPDQALFGRLNGEEFAVALADTPVQGAVAVAEALRQALPGISLPAGCGRITASFAVATAREGEGMEALMTRADAALYEAKAGGRDRIRQAL